MLVIALVALIVLLTAAGLGQVVPVVLCLVVFAGGVAGYGWSAGWFR